LYGSFVNPSACFGSNTSIFILLGPYIGGIGTVMGSLFGSTIVIILQELARSLIKVSGGHYMLMGLLLITVMMLSKEGIYPGLVKLIGKIKKSRTKRD
jgi:ABC-type branched-subunit amino acid transport system permease subunit